MLKAETLPVKVRTSAAYGDLPLPAYATPAAAGLDLLACIAEEIVLPPGGRALIPLSLIHI